MNSQDLQNNLLLLDFWVGKAVQLAIAFENNWHPSTEPEQCLSFTEGYWVFTKTIIENNEKKKIWSSRAPGYDGPYAFGPTELIARCIALVMSKYGEDLPDE